MNFENKQPLVDTVLLPDYHLDKRANYDAFGKAIDDVVKKHFLGKDVAIRGISLANHPGKTMSDMVATILSTGTDRYDAAHEPFWKDFPEYKNKGIELFAGKEYVDKNFHSSHDLIENFFEGAKVDRGYAVRLDIITIYDVEQLEMIPIQYSDGIGRDAWKFKHPEEKEKAVLGVIKIK